MFRQIFLFLTVVQKSSGIWFKWLAGFYFILAFLYISLVIKPGFYVHHQQAPFLLTRDFLNDQLQGPGGLSQWMANLFMQSFYSPLLGPLVLFALAFMVWLLALKLMNRVHRASMNVLLALLPFTLSIVLFNHYNFPLSVLISILLLQWLVLMATQAGKGLFARMIGYTAGAFLIFYISGGAYLILYSLVVLIMMWTRGSIASARTWQMLLATAWMLGLASLTPRLNGEGYLWFFQEKPYFMVYEASSVFFAFLLSVPFLLVLSYVMAMVKKKVQGVQEESGGLIGIISAVIFMTGLALFSHMWTFRSDARKIVASDYYAYHQDVERTTRAAKSLENYSFSANVNYVIAISRQGTATRDFFDFFQVSGTEALQPDIEFSPEMLFIAGDFYYDLGYISEARHNAYEALVYFPYSPRALQLLLKVHLVCGEYKAAERCLFLLEKGLVSRKMVEKYRPLVEDPSMIASDRELMEKRSYIPAGKELSPYAEQRFRELLAANPENRLAYEYLMLYYLLDGNLDAFLEHLNDAGSYFDRPVGVYEEALLMYQMMKPEADPLPYEVSQASRERFDKFSRFVKQYEGNRTMARNVLYWEMGESYMYYLSFVFPRIVKPEMMMEEYDEAPI